MFEQLAEKFTGIFKRLRSKGRLTEEDVDAVLRDLRLVLLESDVHYRVVKDLIAWVRERAVGKEVLESITPGEMVIKILWDEVRKILGGEAQDLCIPPVMPTLFLLVGLQGSGKTTTCGKLGLFLKERHYFPVLVSVDTRRPAAREQLRILASMAGLDFFDSPLAQNPLQVIQAARQYARERGKDIIIVDTAGRLHVEEELLRELQELTKNEEFHEIFLVLDATTGQEAVRVAEKFREWVQPTGIILTKVDTDARAGALLSIVSRTGWPVKFVGMGEKLNQFEVFRPERMASRILGMGDTLSLVEKIERAINEEERKKLEKKVEKAEFDFEDFLEELRRVRQVSSFEEILGMLPAPLRGTLAQVDGEKSFRRIEAIVLSMTREERKNPAMINASRKRRIAQGSGTSVQEVNRLLREFEEIRRIWKKARKGQALPFQRRKGFFGFGF
ncbi:MAG: signal recognition particle protein [Candidatus Caldatribacteriaceae bacterium]